MNFNTFGFSTPRALALGTVAAALGLSIASGVFSTFYTTIQSGQTCLSAYGYSAGYGYGYGYNCTPISIGGGGGGSSSYTPPSASNLPVSTPIIPGTAPSTVVVIIAKDLVNNPFRLAIETLIQAGVMNNATILAPNRSISRAEFLKLLSIANGYKTPVKVTKKFGDLPITNTLAVYVNYGVSMGWVNTKNTNFRPNDIISQGEIEKLIAAIKKTANADTVARKSSGVSRGKAASDIVAAFYAK